MEDLEVDLRIANARAEVAIDLVRTLVRELAGVVSWGEQDLFRSYLNSQGAEPDPARDYACIDLFDNGEPDLRRRERLDHEIRKQIRQDRASLL